MLSELLRLLSLFTPSEYNHLLLIVVVFALVGSILVAFWSNFFNTLDGIEKWWPRTTIRGNRRGRIRQSQRSENQNQRDDQSPPNEGTGTREETNLQSEIPKLEEVESLQTSSTTSLSEMLNAALLVRGSDSQSEALGIVAKAAVKQGNYHLAVSAAAKCPLSSKQAEALREVALAAARCGQFDHAVKAANLIGLTSVSDQTMTEVLATKSRQLR